MPAVRYNYETKIGGTEATFKYKLYLSEDGPTVKATVQSFGGSTTSRHHDSVVVDPQDLPADVRTHFRAALDRTERALRNDG